MFTVIRWAVIVALCLFVALFLVAFVSNLFGHGATTGL